MAVSVYNQVNACYGSRQISGLSACAFLVYAKMAEADDVVTAFSCERVHLCLRCREHFLSVQELQVLYGTRCGFCLSFRCIQTENTDFHAAFFQNGRCAEISVICAFFQYISRQNGDVASFQNCRDILQCLKAEVKFVVTERNCVIPCCYEILRRFQTFFVVYQCGALRKVTGIQQDNVRTESLIMVLQRCHTGNTNLFFCCFIMPVHIVCVQNNQLSVHIVRQNGNRQTHYHRRRKQR